MRQGEPGSLWGWLTTAVDRSDRFLWGADGSVSLLTLLRGSSLAGQLGEFREGRAIPDLQRLAGFDTNTSEDGPFGRTRMRLVALAREALH